MRMDQIKSGADAVSVLMMRKDIKGAAWICRGCKVNTLRVLSNTGADVEMLRGQVKYAAGRAKCRRWELFTACGRILEGEFVY